ncbi:hypothetical protein MYX82_13625, partial [Acidobacteria bacterium AH-259-D05]|nr:hypothetical protein [Acidobacteria bacterium AH-259-D05]
KLNDVVWMDIVKTYLSPIIEKELDTWRFAEDPLFLLSENPIGKNQQTLQFQNDGDFRWKLQRIRDPRSLPTHIQYGINFVVEERGLPFSSFWLGTDEYIEPAHIREARFQRLRKEREARRELRALRRLERANRPRKDPVICGKWRRGFFLLGRWQ